MKCEIIKDLLPSYVDELTSAESNKEIESHLEYCPECKEYLEEIRKDIEVDKTEKDKNIEVFIKVKEKTVQIIIGVVMILVVIVAIIYGRWEEYYHNGRSITSDEVEVSLKDEEGIRMLVYEPKDENVVFLMGHMMVQEINGKMPVHTFTLIKYNKHPEINAMNDSSYKFYMLDEDTIMDLYSQPNILEYSEDDFFAVEFDDCVKTIKISDLVNGNIESLK